MAVTGSVWACECRHRLIFGEKAAQGVAEQAAHLQARRIVILTSASLAAGPLVKSIEVALGKRHAAIVGTVSTGAPRDDIMVAAAKAREVGADLLVAVGGGSVIDAAKQGRG